MPETLAPVVHDAFETEQLAFFRALVEQPSHTYEREDVEAAASLLDAMAASVGLTVERHPATDPQFADHRVYRTPACGLGDRSLALVGHIDTVFPRSMGFFGFERDGNTARGPGTLDMKSGLSAVFFALRALPPEAMARLPLRVVVVTDEEVGSPSSAELYAQLAPRLTAALVFEAGRKGDQIVVARKGSARATVQVRGREAHSGNNHKDGVNAIHALSLLVPRLEALTDYDQGLTVNVGTFHGGTAKNTVPGSAECVMDVRFERLTDVARFEQALAEIASTPLPGRLASAEVTARFDLARPPMEASPQSTALRVRYEAHAARAGLATGAAPLQGGGSDANLLAADGVPCIDGLGPYGQFFHQREEWCSLSSLERRTTALADFLADWAARPTL
jgi:glutamate carboxypeptidase